jgi:acetyl-CoA synthetase
MPEAIVWRPDAETIARAQLTRFLRQVGMESYAELETKAAADPAWFTGEVLRFLDLPWERPYSQVMDTSRGIAWTRWCVDGELNIGTACLAKGPDRQPAVAWEGEEGVTRSWSYRALRVAVQRCASGLRAMGIGKGDAVGVHLPMMPETVAVMVALARIGAIAVPLFTGFGPAAIAARLRDVGAKAVFTCNAFPRRGKLVEAKRAVDEADAAPLVIVVDRVEGHPVPMREGRDLRWDALCAMDGSHAPERTGAEDPLLLIYTSGTTGAPKGILHTHCGFPVKTAQDMAFGMDVGLGTRISWLTDIGWMMGPWLIYGTLLLGGTLALFDGSPEHFWAFAARQGVEVLGVSPTLVRTLMGTPIRNEFNRLRLLASTGEPWTRDAWMWLFETVGQGKLPLINYSGGTEVSGGILCSNPLLPIKPCAFSAACPGMAADIVEADENGVGELVIRQPWIGMARGFYNDPERYLETYWSQYPGVWRHGDFAARDADGFWYIHGRSDDTIKIAGKRVGPAEVETIVTSHAAIREAAAIGVPDELKGSELVVYCVRQGEVTAGEVQELVAQELGRPLRPREVRFVSALPKTRNGKVMRRLVRAARLGLPLGDTSNLENPEVLQELE